MKGFALSVLATAAAVALAMPHGESGAKKPLVNAVGASAQGGNKQGWGGVMVLDRNGDGHFYATAQIDSSDYHMLVDTGASMVALTGDDARQMGLDWNDDALSPVAQGASGPVMGVHTTIPQMAVGDFEARNVDAVIIPDGLPVSLLGQSFLRNVPNVSIADDKLTLSD